MRTRSLGLSLWLCAAALTNCSAHDDHPSIPLTIVQQPLKSPDDALLALQQSLHQHAPERLSKLPKQERATLINALAWYDEDLAALHVTRGPKGQVEHVSSRWLAHDVAPGLPEAPSVDRAKAATLPGGIVRALSAVGDADELVVAGSHPRGKEGKRFLVEQRHKGVRVHGAVLSFDLDARGRLTRFDGSSLPKPTPEGGALIDEKTAAAVAEKHLLGLGEPWTKGDIVTLEKEAVVARQGSTSEQDKARFAYRLLMAIEGNASALREVLVDRITKATLGSVDQVKYLTADDRITRASGAIGLGADSTGEVLWRGDEACASTSSEISGETPIDRDLNEAAAALCEAERVFATFGPEFGIPDPRAWMDRGPPGVHLSIGATPALSVGLNNRTLDLLVFAEGVARAEIVGHEIFHTTLGLLPFSGRNPAEGDAVAEHLCDAFGVLLERRFELRRENDCAMNDDPDSLASIASQDLSLLPSTFPIRPCALEGVARPWRNACDPRADNGGWCEGASRYRDLALNKYDAYGDTSLRDSTHVASHTNLGLGNRAILSLLGEVSGATPHRVGAVDEADVMRLVLGTAAELASGTDWSAYAHSMVRVAATLSGSTLMSPLEREARAALANADIWSMPTAVLPRTGPGAPPSSPAPPPTARPAITKVPLTGAAAGRERTFVFYRPTPFATGIEYVWRDDVAADDTSDLSTGWTGPCTLPSVNAVGSPAAAGSSQAAFVAWAEPTSSAGVNRLRGLRISGEAASSVDSGCDFDWTDNDPPVERLIEGSPALTV